MTDRRFEYRVRPLLPVRRFLLRLVRNAGLAGGIVLGALGIGVLGYRHFEHMALVDAIFNASMILSGMGPAAELHTAGGKLFAAGYAIFSGVVFLTIVAVLFGPLIHRLLHRFHLDHLDRQ